MVSKYTSYVGVDKDRPELIEEEMERRDIPLLNTDGVKVVGIFTEHVINVKYRYSSVIFQCISNKCSTV